MEDYFRCPIIGPCNFKVPTQNRQTLRVWRQSSSEQNQLVVRAEFGFGDGGRLSPHASHWPTSYDFGAGGIMIGLNKKAPISRDPGTIFEFLLPNPPVWYRCQPDMVRCDGCLSDGQKTAVRVVLLVPLSSNQKLPFTV